MSGVPASDVDIVRRAYAALAANDMLELEQCFARDAVWHEPGGNVFSGDRVGWQGIRDEFSCTPGAVVARHVPYGGSSRCST